VPVALAGTRIELALVPREAKVCEVELQLLRRRSAIVTWQGEIKVHV